MSDRIVYILSMIVGFIITIVSIYELIEYVNIIVTISFSITFMIGLAIALVSSFKFGGSFVKHRSKDGS